MIAFTHYAWLLFVWHAQYIYIYCKYIAPSQNQSNATTIIAIILTCTFIKYVISTRIVWYSDRDYWWFIYAPFFYNGIYHEKCIQGFKKVKAGNRSSVSHSDCPCRVILLIYQRRRSNLNKWNDQVVRISEIMLNMENIFTQLVKVFMFGNVPFAYKIYMQDCSISSVLAMELLQSCTKNVTCIHFWLFNSCYR